MRTDDKDANTHSYDCFGQHVRSCFAFPEMDEVAQARPDITISRRDSLFRPPHPSPTPFTEFSPTQQYFDFYNAVQAQIDGAARLSVSLYPNMTEEMLGLPLLGPVMATILHYKGYLVIHGGGVVIDDKLHVFVGHRGAGKSTTIACLLSLGHRLFSDDLIVVDLSDPMKPAAFAGYWALKLTPKAADHFKVKNAKPIANGGLHYPKVRLRIAQPSPPQKMPIHQICALQRADAESISKPDFKTALNVIVENAYMLKYGNAPIAGERGAALFRQAVELATHVRIRKLNTPARLETLPNIEPLLLQEP